MTTDNNPISGSENEGVSCSECGNTVAKDDRFCPHCGERFDGEEGESNTANQVPPNKTVFSANTSIEGTICKICNYKIGFGEEIAKCEKCGSTYHNACWDKIEGCNTKGCLAGRVHCKFCGTLIKSDATVCKNCGKDQRTGSFGTNAGPIPLKDADSAFIWSIVSFFCCGIIMAPMTILQAKRALKTIDANPGMYSNRRKAENALTISWISFILNILALLGQLASAGKN